jgi:hypothetical protein
MFVTLGVYCNLLQSIHDSAGINQRRADAANLINVNPAHGEALPTRKPDENAHHLLRPFK